MAENTTNNHGISRNSFIKGVAAITAVATAPSIATGAARAESRIQAPYVKRCPSGEITIWTADPTHYFLPQALAAFNAAYPDVTVHQVSTPYLAATQKLATTLITGIGAPDGIHFIEDAYLGQYADALYDVGAQVAPYANKIAPYKLAVTHQGGRAVAVPWDVAPAFLIYRTDIVAKAGVDVSKIRTYDDLIAAAQQVKKAVPSCSKPLFFTTVTAPTGQYGVFQTEGLAWQQHTGLINTKGELQLLTRPYTNAFNYYERAYKAGVVGMADFFLHVGKPGLKGVSYG